MLRDGRTLTLPYVSNWLFFIDDHPYHDWGHPCRYISIDCNTGEHQTIADNVYPLGLYNNYDEISIVPLPIIEPISINGKSITESAPINPHLYAVIVCPTNEPSDLRHWNHTSAMFTTLTEKYGYSESNIFVHYIDSSATLGYGNDLNNDGTYDIDYDSRKITLQKTFEEFAGTSNNDPNIPQLSEKDQLLIFFTDHGFTDDVDSYLFVQYPTDDPIPSDYILWDYELAEYLEPINCAHLIVVIQACVSGGFSRKLVDYDNYNVECKNRTVHTSSDSTLSWLNYAMYKNDMGEFYLHWHASLRGGYPKRDKPWEEWYSLEESPSDSCYNYGIYIDDPHPGPRVADSSGDGVVQMGEIFKYANFMDEYSPTGYNPHNGNYIEKPQNSTTFGFKEDLLSLHGMGGVVTYTQEVEGNFLVTSDLIIDNNAIVTISSNSSFHLYGDSKIIVNEGSSLILEDNVSITREGSNEGIQVNGELIVGDISLLADLIVKTNGTLKLTSNLTIKNNTDLVLENGAVVSGDENYPNTLIINGDLNILNGFLHYFPGLSPSKFIAHLKVMNSRLIGLTGSFYYYKI